jgi:hypothetical protein
VALFAVTLAIYRACSQAVTIDEADTYFWFVARSVDNLWCPFPNNHVLNTLLIWVSIHAFGLSALSLRLPALLGAVLYISTCYYLCRALTDRLVLQLTIFICLVYHPFVLDFMSAARGYSLANAFLLAAIAVPVRESRSALRSCAWASLLLGLSFCANFPFAFVDFAAFLAIAIWAVRRRGEHSPVRILAFCAIPGLIAVCLICGYPLTHWPSKDELWYGSHSLTEMTHSLRDATFYRLSPRLAQFQEAAKWMRYLPVILGLLCGGLLVSTRLDGSWRADPTRHWLGKFIAGLSGIFALCLSLHWLAFRFCHLLLPRTRTGIFFLPLLTLTIAAIAASPARSSLSRGIRQSLRVSLYLLASYYLLCLRADHFQEYRDDADVKKVYDVLAKLNHCYRVNDIAINGTYSSSLNFLRLLSRQESFPEFLYGPDEPPPGKPIYVLHDPYHRAFIEKQQLTIIYRGETTEVVVAVPPGGPIPPLQIQP